MKVSKKCVDFKQSFPSTPFGLDPSTNDLILFWCYFTKNRWTPKSPRIEIVQKVHDLKHYWNLPKIIRKSDKIVFISRDSSVNYVNLEQSEDDYLNKYVRF